MLLQLEKAFPLARAQLVLGDQQIPKWLLLADCLLVVKLMLVVIEFLYLMLWEARLAFRG